MENRRLPSTSSPVLPTPARPPLDEPRQGTAILCITEDPEYAERWLVPDLHSLAEQVDLIPSGQAIELGDRPYRLLVLDVGWQRDRSFKLCAQLRSATRLPLLLVLRGQAREDVLRAFQAGADAYVMAPFDRRELVARAGALIHRTSARAGEV